MMDTLKALFELFSLVFKALLYLVQCGNPAFSIFIFCFVFMVFYTLFIVIIVFGLTYSTKLFKKPATAEDNSGSEENNWEIKIKNIRRKRHD